MRPRRLGTDKQMAHTSSSGSADQAGHFGSTSVSTVAIVVVVVVITRVRAFLLSRAFKVLPFRYKSLFSFGRSRLKSFLLESSKQNALFFLPSVHEQSRRATFPAATTRAAVFFLRLLLLLLLLVLTTRTFEDDDDDAFFFNDSAAQMFR